MSVRFLKYSTLPVQPHVADKTSEFAELFCLLNLLRSSAVVTTPSPSPPPTPLVSVEPTNIRPSVNMPNRKKTEKLYEVGMFTLVF